MAEPPRRMRRSAANAAERILTLLLAISCPSPRHAAAPRQAHAAQPWAVYLVLRVRGGAARASEDARGVRLTRPDPCAFGTIRDTFGPTTVDDSSDDASRPTAERRVHALDSDRERKELRRRPGESKDGGASPARSGTAVPVRGRPQRWHSVPGRWWRQAQRAARRVMFEARNVVSGGAHALYWKRLVWTAVASGERERLLAAHFQGVPMSFHLRAIGPHQRLRDMESEKTPLHLAAGRGDSRMVRTLIDLGARVDEMDHRGRSALHRAVARGHLGVCGVLLKRGACVNKPASGQCSETPVHVAVRHCFSGSLRLLMRSGASVNSKTTLGETPLHIAATHGHLSMVRELLIAGADWRPRAINGWTAATCAQKARHNRVYVYLSKVANGRISVKRMQRAEAATLLQRARRDCRRKQQRRPEHAADKGVLVDDA